MAKKPTLILPPGILVFPKLNEVDVYQPVDDKGRPNGAEKRQFITFVRYEADVLAKIEEQITKLAKEAGASKMKLMPFKEVKVSKDSDDKETLLVAKSGEKYRPAVFDARNNKLPVDLIIGGGSKARLDVTINHYTGFGGGVNLYLNSVQILELVEGGMGKSRFDEAEGFAYEGTDSAPAADHNEGDGKSSFAF